jgi:hypothetical protein
MDWQGRRRPYQSEGRLKNGGMGLQPNKAGDAWLREPNRVGSYEAEGQADFGCFCRCLKRQLSLPVSRMSQ